MGRKKENNKSENNIGRKYLYIFNHLAQSKNQSIPTIKGYEKFLLDFVLVLSNISVIN